MAERLNQKTYGPREWPTNLLDRAYRVLTDNNDNPVTQDIVDGWVRNFERHSTEFRTAHQGLITQLKSE